jgi:hypothetical protein
LMWEFVLLLQIFDGFVRSPSAALRFTPAL